MHRATLFVTRVNLRWKNKGEKMDGTVGIVIFMPMMDQNKGYEEYKSDVAYQFLREKKKTKKE